MPLTQSHVSSGFEKVADLFANFAKDEEAQLAIYRGKELVLDLASNLDPDALMTVYSVSKGLSALAMAKLVETGKLDLDQTVAHYWPEFAAKEKQSITVRQLLSHQAGLPEIDRQLTEEELLDGLTAADLLAQQRPLWYPGKAHGYHGLTIGPLMSKLVHQITGQTLQQYYESEIRSKAQGDAYLGLPEELEPRVVDLLPAHPPTAQEQKQWGPLLNWSNNPLNDLTFGRGLEGASVIGSRARRHGLPSAAGVASARGLAKVTRYAIDHTAPEVFERFGQMQAYGLDIILDQPARGYGIIFMKPTPTLPFGSHQAFGHDGAAGCMLIADPETDMVLGYTVRRCPTPGGMDRRLLPLIQEFRRSAN
ncbi:MAG: serine hydrolase domain-containing protein [Micrococcales bacterium]